MSLEPVSLYVVSTPLGHLGDMTARAIEVLTHADRIAAEDTRHTAGLLRHFSIQTPLLSCHDFNEEARIQQFASYLERGESLALVSDAGTPLISDPGFKLVRGLVALGYKVIPVPGACAITTALVASGLPSDRFAFYGFPPAKQSARLHWLNEIKVFHGTLIFYESKHRILNCLNDMLEAFGDMDACVGREMTKEHESFYRGTLSQILQELESLPQLLGEFVVMVHYLPEVQAENPLSMTLELEVKELLELLQHPPAKKQLAAVLAEKTSIKKQDWYKSLIALESSST